MPLAPSSAVSSTSPSSWIFSTTLSVNRLGWTWHDQVVYVCVSRERKFLGFLIHVSNAFCCRPADPKGRKRRIKCCVQKIKLQSLQSGFVVFFQPTLKGSKSFELFLKAITLININLTTWWWMRNVLVDLVMVHAVQARFFQITNLDLQMQIDSKFPLQPRHKYYITQYEELELSSLTQMKDDYTTILTDLTYTREKVLLNLGMKGLNLLGRVQSLPSGRWKFHHLLLTSWHEKHSTKYALIQIAWESVWITHIFYSTYRCNQLILALMVCSSHQTWAFTMPWARK